MVSRIGSPVTDPALVHVKLATRDGVPPHTLERRVRDVTADRLALIPTFIDAFVAGTISVY